MSEFFYVFIAAFLGISLVNLSSGLEAKWKAQARLIEAQAEKIEEDDTLHGPGDEKSFGA